MTFKNVHESALSSIKYWQGMINSNKEELVPNKVKMINIYRTLKVVSQELAHELT